MDVVITGIGLKSCLGYLEQTWLNILQGQSGIQIRQPFPQLAAYPLGLIAPQPAEISQLTTNILEDTLNNAGLNYSLEECGVVIGSSRSCQGIWEQLTPLKASSIFNNAEFAWLETLPHQPANIVAQALQTLAPVLAPMAACATGIWALFRGYELIRTGRCQRVIAGAVETPITPLTIAAFNQMGALSHQGCYPFDRKRSGLVLAEGGAMFILETAELAASRQAPVYGRIGGFGLTCDAHHISSPKVVNGSAAIAIKQSLDHSGLGTRDIDFIHAHGTSTLLNDRHEAQLIQRLFPQGIAVSSTKGATGHTLGASGAIGAALTLMAMHQGYLPTCIGLQEKEFDLNIVTQAQEVEINHAMCFSFGFGGQNAVVTLSK
ncbi:MAG: beta-ketoacyl-ACP synthase [Cyanobacteria bacterium J06558_2]